MKLQSSSVQYYSNIDMIIVFEDDNGLSLHIMEGGIIIKSLVSWSFNFKLFDNISIKKWPEYYLSPKYIIEHRGSRLDVEYVTSDSELLIKGQYHKKNIEPKIGVML